MTTEFNLEDEIRKMEDVQPSPAALAENSRFAATLAMLYRALKEGRRRQQRK